MAAPKSAAKKRAAAAAKKVAQGGVEVPAISTTNTISNDNNDSCIDPEDKTDTGTRDTSPTSSSAGSASISNSSSDSLDSSAGSDSVGKPSHDPYCRHTPSLSPNLALLFEAAACVCQWKSVANKGVSWRNTAIFEIWLHPLRVPSLLFLKFICCSFCYSFYTSLKHRYQEQHQQKEKSEAKGGSQEEKVRGYNTYNHNAYTSNNRTLALTRYKYTV